MTLTSAAQVSRSIAALRRLIPAVLVGGILFGSSAPVSAQTILWTRQFGSGMHTPTTGVATDANGNVYVVGRTQGALPGQTQSAPGASDAWVRKYNSAGTVQWTRQFGAGSFASAEGVAVDGTDVYVVGVTDNTLPGQTNGGNFLDDAFVRKYNSAGTILWTRQFGTADNDSASGVAVDGNGKVYVTGATQATLPGQTASGAMDAFLQAFDSAGTSLWTTQFGSAGNEIPWDVAVDAQGNAIVVGFTGGAFPGQTNAGGSDAFVSAFDSAGAPIWTSEFGTTGLDIARRVALDAAGNAYVSGATAGALPGQTSVGGQDAFVLAYTLPETFSGRGNSAPPPTMTPAVASPWTRKGPCTSGGTPRGHSPVRRQRAAWTRSCARSTRRATTCGRASSVAAAPIRRSTWPWPEETPTWPVSPTAAFPARPRPADARRSWSRSASFLQRPVAHRPGL
jgi:hypothetical protein